MKFSATFESRVEQAEEQGDIRLIKVFLNPGDVDPKKPLSFALLEEDPLMYFQTWGESTSGGKKRPFRFVSKPTDKAVRTEMGKEYEWGKAYQSEENAPIKEAMAWPVYDFENKMVRIFSCDQYTIQRSIKRIAANRKYKNLLDWDLCLSKTITDGRTSYDLQVEPRDEDTQQDLEEAWDEVVRKGFDMTVWIDNGDPFNPDA